MGSTISEQGALQLSPSAQEMPSLVGSNRHSSSTKVVPKHPVSTKNRLRVDLSDKGESRTSSPAAKETSKATITPQLSPTPSVSVQNALKCSTNDQGVERRASSNRMHAVSNRHYKMALASTAPN